MKKNLFLSTIIAILMMVVSCSKDAKTTSPVDLAQVPSAKVAYDNSNFGVYKGVFIGSSGTIIIDLSNATNSFKATVIINGVTHNFITNQTITQGQTTTINFTEGSNSFTFTVSATGSNPTITNLVINGHPNAAMLVIKETSTVLIKCYEGTFSGNDSGTFNIVINNNTIKGIAKAVTDVNILTLSGTVVNNQLSASGSASSGATFTGALSGDNFSGNWVEQASGKRGTFSGVRTY